MGVNETSCSIRSSTGGREWRARRLAGVALVCLGAACLARSARALEERKRPPLSGRIVCASARARSSGPLAVHIELNWRGSGLIEGRLEIDLAEGSAVRCRYARPDVALTNGPQRIRLVLPSPGPGGYDSQLEARMVFVSDDGAFRLPPCPLFVPKRSDRGLVVALADPRGRPGPETLALFKALRLEQFAPERRAARSDASASGARPLVTTPAFPTPGDMPSNAAAYCAFDTVCLAGEGFALMSRKQLDATLTWVRAGGSVLVLPAGGLKAHHARFMNALAGATDAARPAYALTPRGRVEGKAGLGLLRAGLGRAVVGLDVATDDDALGRSDWRRAAGFLWKVRRDQLKNIARRGKWGVIDEEETSSDDWRLRQWQMQYQQHRDGRRRYGRVPVMAGPTLKDKVLFPKKIQVVPLWLIIMILLLFVVVIGPVDYFVLGLFRRRKLTWITFPAAAVGFALFTMLLAEAYMGSTDHRNSLTVVDLGAGGRVLRTSRYEVIVAGRNRNSRTDIAGGFFSPIDVGSFPGGRGMHTSGGRGVPAYEGLVPARFSVMQRINQWEPRMNRYLFVGPEAPPVQPQDGRAPLQLWFNWDAVGKVALTGDIDFDIILRMNPALDKSGAQRKIDTYIFGGGQRRVRCGRYANLADEVLNSLCVRPRQGFFTVVSQVSPTGGGDFEDVAVLDPTDESQLLIAVVVRDGQNFTVYRRLYHKGADAR